MSNYFVLFFILQILDGLLTYRIVGKEGGRELNPFMHWLFGKLGMVQSLVIVKGLLLCFLYVFDSMIPQYGWIGINTLYVIVVMFNVSNLKGQP